MAIAQNRHHKAKQTTGALIKELAVWRAEIAEETTVKALRAMVQRARQENPPGLGLIRSEWDRKIDEWLAPFVADAVVIGETAARHAVERLFYTGLASKLAAAARSHSGRKANSYVKEKKGGKPAKWRLGIEEKILSDRRFMKKSPSNDDIIERALILNILDQANRTRDPDSVYYLDYKTEKQVASGKANLRAEISRLKTKFLQQDK